MNSGGILYPNVTSLPSQTGVSHSERPSRKGDKGEVNREFENVLDKELEKTGGEDLTQVRTPLKFSAHATQRLRDRNLSFDPMTMEKIKDAIDKAEAKGVDDTLVLTSNAALIVNVKNRTVITAMDRSALVGNVFTQIDGAVVV